MKKACVCDTCIDMSGHAPARARVCVICIDMCVHANCAHSYSESRHVPHAHCRWDAAILLGIGQGFACTVWGLLVLLLNVLVQV